MLGGGPSERDRDGAWEALIQRLHETGLLDGHGPIAGQMLGRVFTHAAYRDVDPDVLTESWRRNLSVFIAGLLERRLPSAEDDDSPLREVGEERARQGVGVAEMLQTAMRHQQVFVDLAREVAPPSPYRDSLLLELFGIRQAWSAWAMIALAEGHREADLEMQRRTQERQDSFVRRLISGSLTVTEIVEGAAAYGLDLDRRYRAFRARPAAGSEALRGLERYLRVTPSAERRNGMLAVIDGDVCGFLSVVPAEPPPTTVGVSRAVPLHELSSAFGPATRALETALAMGLTAIVGVEDLGLHPAVVAEHELGERMHDRFVKPVLRSGDSGAAVLETVERYLRNGSRLDVTRQELFLHTNTVRYRLSRFETLTGCSLRDHETLAQVWWALAWNRLRR